MILSRWIYCVYVKYTLVQQRTAQRYRVRPGSALCADYRTQCGACAQAGWDMRDRQGQSGW